MPVPAKIQLLRVSLHPWIWWMLVKRALTSFTQGEFTVENRRRMAAILAILEDGLDPDDIIFESPYARLSKHEVEARTARNSEIEKECERTGADPRYIEASAVDGKVVRGWMSLPKPDLRVSLSFTKEDLRVVENAVEAYARKPDIDHSFDRAFVDALDAIKAATPVEIPIS